MTNIDTFLAWPFGITDIVFWHYIYRKPFGMIDIEPFGMIDIEPFGMIDSSFWHDRYSSFWHDIYSLLA